MNFFVKGILSVHTVRFPYTCWFRGGLLQTWGCQSEQEITFHLSPLISEQSPSAPLHYCPENALCASLGSEPGCTLVILLGKDCFCARGKPAPCLYFKQPLTTCRPHAWQVLFLRCSETCRGDNHSTTEKAPEQGNEQGVSRPGEHGAHSS